MPLSAPIIGIAIVHNTGMQVVYYFELGAHVHEWFGLIIFVSSA